MADILVVEDDMMLNAGLCYNFQEEGWQVFPAHSLKEAAAVLGEKKVHLVLLDVNLPDGSGFELGKKIREEGKIPVIYLTANDTDEDMIKGFESGGDDYITKPFNIKIVMQRMRAILRRCESEWGSVEKCGNLEVDFDRHTLKKEGVPVVLTPTEYKLLCKFWKHKGQVLTRQILLADLWDAQGNFVDEHTLTINISRLRSKIADETFTYLKTIYGVGYMWTGEDYE